MERGPEQTNERPATDEEREELQRQLGSLGLYDANDGTLGPVDHQESFWPHTNVLPGED